jgi:hypothetical protein
MRLWHSIFIVTFIMLYGTLSLVVLGEWVREKAKALKAARAIPPAPTIGKEAGW